MDFTLPRKLQADNFTPLKRTPWAGTAITSTIKDAVLPGRVGEAVGESWEFSCDPQMPSRLVEGDMLLADYCRLGGERVLGEQVDRVDILVKLLHAASPLSLQLHPTDGDPNLKSSESGKPESWLVWHCEPGAGLYLGFREAIALDTLRELLESGADLRPHLQFVPVKPYDYFEILPHVPHAIGPGVLLLEPQRVLPGKSGKTYRLWDWNRTYDEQGQPSPQGSPRQLHIAEALPLLDPGHQCGDGYVATLRREAELTTYDGLTIRRYPANDCYQLVVIESTSQVNLWMHSEGYLCLTNLQGEFRWSQDHLRQGETAILPQSCLPSTFTLKPQTRLCLLGPALTPVQLKLA